MNWKGSEARQCAGYSSIRVAALRRFEAVDPACHQREDNVLLLITNGHPNFPPYIWQLGIMVQVLP